MSYSACVPTNFTNTVLAPKITLATIRQWLPFILKTNRPLPTLSTLLKDCFISAKLDQSASFTMRYQRQTSILWSGRSFRYLFSGAFEIITIRQMYEIIS
ncbi:hypothetical protein M949_1804 [Riemerella anatipestifer CH3]|nr:hypothetical protein M949_1804 [Riemerella anatipestifer CH3]